MRWLTAFLIAASLYAQKNYFQQRVEYLIKVRLDDNRHMLHGWWQMKYYNNSPDTLTVLYIHLWPNAYKNRKTPFAKQMLENGNTRFHFAKKEERGWIDSLDFQVNGQTIQWHYWDIDEEVAVLHLPQPLKPGEYITITTPFRVKIPYTFSRLGHVGKQYQITQWYPKPAVYDHKGWHFYPYVDQGEFYSEWGSFEVHITVPKHYVVGATGRLQNKEEWQWLKEREEKTRAYLECAPQCPKPDYLTSQTTEEYKTLVYVQDSIHDFAWFADPTYHVLSDTVHLPYSNRVVKVFALFNDEHKNTWKKATEYLKEAIYYYSLYVGEYPYDFVTAVDGALSAGGGMEYPMITVISSPAGLLSVIIHEVGHNWFYGILGSNEREHPWMDEGINSYYENRIIHRKHWNANRLGISVLVPHHLTTAWIHSQNLQQPVDLHAEKYSELNYGGIVYMKSVLLLRYLEQYLGIERFDKAMQTYFERWKFKHPYPENMQQVFEEVTGEDLAWFFQGLLKSSAIPDLRMKVQQHGKQATLIIQNRSKDTLLRKIPAIIAAVDKEGKLLKIWKTKPISIQQPETLQITIPDSTKYLSIDPWGLLKERKYFNQQYFPNKPINKHCGFITLNNIFYQKKGASPFSNLGSICGVSPRRSLWFLPSIGYNTLDQWMIGAGLFFQPFPMYATSFHVLGMYSLTQKRLLGSAGFTYRLYFKDVFRKLLFRARVSSFANYFRTKYAIEGYVKNTSYRWKELHLFSLQAFQLGARAKGRPHGYVLDLQEPVEGIDSVFLYNDGLPVYYALRWDFEHYYPLYVYGWHLELGLGNRFQQWYPRAMAEIYGGYTFFEDYKVRLRIFGGYLVRNNSPQFLYFYLAGYDAFGEYLLIDRVQIQERPIQIVDNQGMFKAPINATANQWMVSTALEIYFTNFLSFHINYALLSDYAHPSQREFYNVSLGWNITPWFGVYLPIYNPSLYPKAYPSTYKELGNVIVFKMDFLAFQRAVEAGSISF